MGSQKTPLGSSSFPWKAVLEIWDIPGMLWWGGRGAEQPLGLCKPRNYKYSWIIISFQQKSKAQPTHQNIKLINSIPAQTQSTAPHQLKLNLFSLFQPSITVLFYFQPKFRYLSCKLHFPTCSATFHIKDLQPPSPLNGKHS